MNTKGRKEQIVRLGRGLEYKLIIQRGKGRNAEFIAGVHFAGKPTRRELRKWRDAIQRGIEPNAAGQGRREATYPEPAGSAPLVAQPPRDVSELYHELLYAVARKFPGESRHETALRYIRDTEERACEGGSCKQNTVLRRSEPAPGGNDGDEANG